MSDGCKIKKTDDIYSVGYNTQQDAIKIYCEGGVVATVPSSPTNVAATPGNGQVSLTWSAPNDGGSAITDYKIEYSSNGFIFNEFAHSASSNTTIVVTGLTNNTLYIFRVSAINAVGTGNPSGFSNAVKPLTTPGAPSIISLVRLAGTGAAISVTWSAPSSNGGSPIQQYDVNYSDNSGSSWSIKSVSGNTLSTIVDSLTPGESYIFRIIAINAAGAGTFSSNSAPIIPATVPSEPTNVVGTVGDSQISLTWNAPSFNGGLSITDYTIQYKADGEENWQIFSDGTSANTSAVVTSLINGVSYIFRVLATNAVGDSIESTISSEVVPGAVPDVPTNLNATAGDGFVSLSWSAGEDNGYPIQDYTVRYSSNNGSTWTIYDTTTPTTSLVINGFNNDGTSYIFQVKATNGIGDSSYSSSSNSVTPLANITCTTGPISHDYVLVFTDEAHPLYVKGSGDVGALWGADLAYYNNILSNFPTCATILFDVDTPFVARGSYKGQTITSDPFYIFPTGANTSQYTQCHLPIDNVTGIARPSGGIEYNGSTNAVGSISAESFATGIVNAIETFWGSNFWPRMTGSFNTVQNRPAKLWITRGHTISLGSGILSSGIEIFSNYVINNKNWTQNNIGNYINNCGERYLGWITDVIQSQGNTDSCNNMTRVPDITQDNECGSNPGDRLVKFYFNDSCTDNLNNDYVQFEEIRDGIEPWADLAYVINPLFSCKGIYNSDMVSNFLNNGNKLLDWMDFNIHEELVSEGYIYLTYVNNVPYLEIVSNCYEGPSNLSQEYRYIGNSTRWITPVPLDSYGIPSGIVEETYGEQNITQGIEPGTCSPSFPDIRFESSPACSTNPLPGSICLSINQ